MFELEENDLVRIERSPYLNGHYYLRFTKKGKPKNLELTQTVGFGYDDPYREESILLSNPLVVSLRMFNAIFEPISNKWVIYKNDHARNWKGLPNIYHTVTNWFKISKDTANDINNAINCKGGESHFKKSFSPVATDMSNNCRSILVSFLRSSLSSSGIKKLENYLDGNPLEKDHMYGCVILNVDNNGDIFLVGSHYCGLSYPNNCCYSVVKPKELCNRTQFKI